MLGGEGVKGLEITQKGDGESHERKRNPSEGERKKREEYDIEAELEGSLLTDFGERGSSLRPGSGNHLVIGSMVKADVKRPK